MYIQCIDIQMCIAMVAFVCCILYKLRSFGEENWTLSSRFQAGNNSLPMAFDGIVICARV